MTSLLVFAVALVWAGCSKQSETAKNESGSKKNVTENTAKQETGSVKVPAGKKIAVNTTSSNLAWEGKKVTGKHNGVVKIKSGDLYVDGQKITGGAFDIDFSTIEVIDIKDPEMNSKLVNHLKSDDFFAASSHPVGKFAITAVEPMSDEKGHNMKINGTLTIKGITQPVSFPAKITIDGDKVEAVADLVIDRTLWDIKFRSGKFFQDLGDNLIYDDITIKLDLKAGV